MRLTWAQVLARRLERHALSGVVPGSTIADTVHAMCGVHAQVMTAAELSIGIRMTDVTRQDVQRALWSERRLVKTYGPRGTIHLLPTDALPMWTGALSAVPAGTDGLPPELRLTSDQLERCIAAIAIALDDAELTTDELGDRVVASTGPWAAEQVIPAFDGMWARWRRALIPAARAGVLCFGPDRGRNVTYTSPRRWSPGFRTTDQDGAVGDLVLHYLDAYGPATPAQFAQWLAAPRRWATDLFDRLRPELVEVDVEGTGGWLAARDTGTPTDPPRGIRLLPYFDAYTVGCHPRERIFPGRARERALSRGQAGNVPVLLVDGVVGGIWHLRRVGRVSHVVVEAFGPLDRHQLRELDTQVALIGRILGSETRLTLGAVVAGRHL